VEIGAEAGQFPEKEYINGIAVAVKLKISKEYQIQNKKIFNVIPWITVSLALWHSPPFFKVIQS
jgi:hypothetical protein